MGQRIKRIVQQLQEISKLEKMADKKEETPTAASAADMLLQSLKQPRAPQTDVRPLFALASPSVGQRLLQATQAPKAISAGEERLKIAADIEESVANNEVNRLVKVASLTIGGTGNAEKDMRALEKVGSMASGTGRGATNMRKAWENIAQIDKLKSMAEDFASGQLTFDRQSNMEYSAAISGLIANRAPGIETIRETAYNYFGGDVNAMVQYITGNPEDALSQKMMNEVSRQVFNIEKSEKHKVSKTLARLFNAYRGRFKRNPEDAVIWQQQYGHLVNFDLDDMRAEAKPFDEVGETRLGREQKPAQQAPDSAGSDKLSRFRKLMGR